VLVFSDEFNEDDRSFYPGDDPYWEAVDLYYWATEDLEWYDPKQGMFNLSLLRDAELIPTCSYDEGWCFADYAGQG